MARNGWRGGYIIATLALFDALALNRLLGSGSIRPRGVHPDAVFRARRPFDYRGRIGRAVVAKDGWMVRTADRWTSAHCEHMLVITRPPTDSADDRVRSVSDRRSANRAGDHRS